MFASTSIAAHTERGVIAAPLLTWAWLHQSSDTAFAVGAGVGAMVAMRGCPLCWTVGLVETIVQTVRVRGGHTCSSEGCSCP